MTFSTRNFDPLPPLAPISPKFCITNISFFCLKHTVLVITYVTNLFLYHMGMESCLPKTTLEPKLAGAGLGEHPENFGTPYLFLQRLKVATSNLVHKVGVGCGEYVTAALVPNLVGAGWSTGAPQKLCGPGTMYPVPRNSCRNVIKLQI